MQSGITLFTPKPDTPHADLKALFLKLLNETERKCNKTYKYSYDQERFHMVGIHPEIDAGKNFIEKSKAKVLRESKVMQNDQNELFYTYTFGLCKLPFDFLFMKIFTEKLKKHWVPVANQYNLSIENNNQLKI